MCALSCRVFVSLFFPHEARDQLPHFLSLPLSYLAWLCDNVPKATHTHKKRGKKKKLSGFQTFKSQATASNGSSVRRSWIHRGPPNGTNQASLQSSLPSLTPAPPLHTSLPPLTTTPCPASHMQGGLAGSKEAKVEWHCLLSLFASSLRCLVASCGVARRSRRPAPLTPASSYHACLVAKMRADMLPRRHHVLPHAPCTHTRPTPSLHSQRTG